MCETKVFDVETTLQVDRKGQSFRPKGSGSKDFLPTYMNITHGNSNGYGCNFMNCLPVFNRINDLLHVTKKTEKEFCLLFTGVVFFHQQ